MPAKYDKVIVTNQAALTAKYGGLAPLKKSIAALIAADKTRGLNTLLVPLDDAKEMSKFGGAAVKKVTDPKQNKQAIDAVYKALGPDYLMILGSIDVVPHQDLVNPVHDPDPDGDNDQLAPGDLPYACSAGYSTKIGDFTAPTRVVGRLPDVTGGNDPAYLVGLLKTASDYKARPFSDYADYLGITAEVWQKSTRQSVEAVFSTASGLKLSPPSGPKWSPALLKRRSVFINCHGSDTDYRFYGQKGKKFPIAHESGVLSGHVEPGTIVAAECCYGAQLYDPAAAKIPSGICNTYLAGKGYGFFGSSTIAYGPEEGNSSADLICQYFFKYVLQGASLGRAVLQARQDFIKAASPMDPFDIKTLGQFSLMGDPAIHAVVTSPTVHSMNLPKAAKKGTKSVLPIPQAETMEAGRELRRARLIHFGNAIGEAVQVAIPSDKGTPKEVERAMLAHARAHDVSPGRLRHHTFEISQPGTTRRAAAKATSKSAKTMLPAGPSVFHVATARLPVNFEKTPQLLVMIVTRQDDNYTLKRLFTR